MSDRTNMASVAVPEPPKPVDGPSVTLTIRLIMQGKVSDYYPTDTLLKHYFCLSAEKRLHFCSQSMSHF